MKESQDSDDIESVKVNCSFCAKEIKCPKDMLQKSKYICYACFTNTELPDEKLEDVYVDIPRDEMEEFIPEAMTRSLLSAVFPDIWKERKQDIKALSKKDLAEEMFGEGAYHAFHMII